MSKLGGSVTLQGEQSVNMSISDPGLNDRNTRRDSSGQKATKMLSDRRRELSKAKDAVHIEERKAMRAGNTADLDIIMNRWDKLHESRHLISPFADCFFEADGTICLPRKSRFLRYTLRDARDIVYPFNQSLERNGDLHQVASNTLFSERLGPIHSIQIDVMNALHYRGSGMDGGTDLEGIVTSKMRASMKRWLSGPNERHLKQLHLHIDDPKELIKQKASEQERRDSTRAIRDLDSVHHTEGHGMELPGFQDQLTIPWGVLLNDRHFKAELASLNLFCAAVAALDLLSEGHVECDIYLHGGRFSIMASFRKLRPTDCTPLRFCEHFDKTFRGSVILVPKDSETDYSHDLFLVPKNRALILHTTGIMRLADTEVSHGEAETRFVTSFKRYIYPTMRIRDVTTQRRTAIAPGGYVNTRIVDESTNLVLSDDTDVFVILLACSDLRGCHIKLVIKDTIHDLDVAFQALEAFGLKQELVVSTYAMAG